MRPAGCRRDFDDADPASPPVAQVQLGPVLGVAPRAPRVHAFPPVGHRRVPDPADSEFLQRVVLPVPSACDDEGDGDRLQGDLSVTAGATTSKIRLPKMASGTFALDIE